MKGALEKILPQCTKYYENGQVYPLSQKKDQEFLTEAYDIGQQGLRGSIIFSKIMNIIGNFYRFTFFRNLYTHTILCACSDWFGAWFLIARPGLRRYGWYLRPTETERTRVYQHLDKQRR